MFLKTKLSIGIFPMGKSFPGGDTTKKNFLFNPG